MERRAVVISNGSLVELPVGDTLAGASGGSGMTATAIKTSAYTAVSNDLVRVDSTSGPFTVTLPSAPVDGDKIALMDVTNQCGTNAVLLAAAGGKTVEGDNTGLTVNVAGAYVFLVYNSTGTNWKLADTPSGTIGDVVLTYSRSGAVAIATGTARIYPPRNTTLSKWELWAGTAPTGSSVIISLLKNGVSIGTFTLPATTNYATGVITTALLTTDYLTVDITQIGSTIAGADLSLRITGA